MVKNNSEFGFNREENRWQRYSEEGKYVILMGQGLSEAGRVKGLSPDGYVTLCPHQGYKTIEGKLVMVLRDDCAYMRPEHIISLEETDEETILAHCKRTNENSGKSQQENQSNK